MSEVNPKIQAMLKALVICFEEVHYDVRSVLSVTDKQDSLINKLEILVDQATILLMRYYSSLASQNCNTTKKEINGVNILKPPRRPQQFIQDSSNDQIIFKCFQGVKDLMEIYSILTKVQKQNKPTMIYKCFQEFENTFKSMQTTLIAFKTDNQNLCTLITQLVNQKISVSVEHNFESNIGSAGNNTNLGNIKNGGSQFMNDKNKNSNHNGIVSEKSAIIIEDLKEEISILNNALCTSDKGYEFQIHKYQEKLMDLDITVCELKDILWDNQRMYQYQIQTLQTQIYEYKLLVRNMARKIRNYERNIGNPPEKSYQTDKNFDLLRQRSGRFITERVDRGDRNTNYMCPRLSRERERAERQNSRDRETNIGGFRRSISRGSRNGGLRYSNNSLSRNKLI